MPCPAHGEEPDTEVRGPALAEAAKPGERPTDQQGYRTRANNSTQRAGMACRAPSGHRTCKVMLLPEGCLAQVPEEEQ